MNIVILISFIFPVNIAQHPLDKLVEILIDVYKYLFLTVLLYHFTLVVQHHLSIFFKLPLSISRNELVETN